MDASSSVSSTQCLLPPEVLQLVLQHVDPKQRLGPCACVCRTWRDAANAATSSIDTGQAQQHATALSKWLQRHGGQVAQLRVTGDIHRPALALPCHQLTKLDSLEAMLMQVTSADVSVDTACSASAEGPSCKGSCGSSPQQQHLAALTQLTQLKLQWTQWSGSLQPLSTLTRLRHLHLQNISCPDDASPAEGAPSKLDAAVGSALPHLVQLTSLHLEGSDISDVALAHISDLTQLQTLELCRLQVTSSGLAGVPNSLTRLELVAYPDAVNVYELSSTTTPALAQLTALQHLGVHCSWELEPMLLSQMAQLTHLSLCSGNFLPGGSGGTQRCWPL